MMKQLRKYLAVGANSDTKMIKNEFQRLDLMMGKVLSNQVRALGILDNIQDSEFKVFSQFGDDGIIQYLIDKVEPVPEAFIEFGVGSYAEANTRFLLMNNNWRGLIIDGDQPRMDAIKNEEWYWRYELTATAAFITRDNINELFKKHGFTGEIGLLSIDIDGNDYWVWERINSVRPAIVVVEYNSVFGPDHAITIPYDPEFIRTRSHSSNLYWGCSLKALCQLATKKGYIFVGSNSNGNNAHFVREDLINNIPALTAEQGYVESKFRESRDIQGRLTFLTRKDRLVAIKEMKVYNLDHDNLVRIGDLFDV